MSSRGEMKNGSFFIKLNRYCIRQRLKPISVFLFHHVSEVRNPLISATCDWTQTEQFKKNICLLKKEFSFVSLDEAWRRLHHDRFRFRKFAVLTADDGYRSLLDILPWLEQEGVPITIFVNTKYLDKKSWGEVNEEVAREYKPDVDMLSEVCPDLFMSKEELFGLDSPVVSVGLHGHEHLDATNRSEEEFHKDVEKAKSILFSHPRYVPFYAYAWGHHNVKTDRIVREMDLVPVLVNDMKNDNNTGYINRICIDGKML